MMPPPNRRMIAIGFLVFVLARGAAAQVGGEFTGWFDLQARLGANMPTGQDMSVLHVEALAASNEYLPFQGQGTGHFAGKTNIDHSGGGAISGHAVSVGRRWYSNSIGYAPGIVTVESYEAGDYLTRVLFWTRRVASPDWAMVRAAMDPGDARVINNSWIITETNNAEMRARVRCDYQIERYEMIYLNGVGNGAGSRLPYGLTSSYNGIAVGRSDGNSSAGPTRVEGDRMKPDIVAPDTTTSGATPLVSGGAIMLLDQSERLGLPKGQDPRVIKAILYAGAEKLAGWEKGDPGPGDDVIHPIDWRQGAGELQVDRNYDIMAGGRFPANTGARLGRRAWSFDTIGFNEINDYLIAVVTENTTLSVGLAWYRHHTGNFWVDSTWPLNNIALELWESDGNGQPTTLLQESRSLIDNVQHVYLEQLPPGVYLVRLIGLTDNNPGAEDYGLAWWTEGEFVRGDMNGDGVFNGGDIDPFFLALGDPAAFMLQFPGIDPQIWGDMNCDYALNGADIDPFFECLGGGPCPCP